MTRGTIFAVLFVCFVSTSPALAGTWKDDFEDGDLDGWEIYNAIPVEKWGVEDGECSGEWLNADPGSFSVLVLKLESSAFWKDYTVECKMKFTGNRTPFGYAGISFRDGRMMGSGSCAFDIDARSGTASGWTRTAIAAPWKNVSKAPLPFALSKDTWYKLKIIAEGDHFEFYIDGKPAGKFVDDSNSSGGVGLEVRNVHVHFDDIIISGDEVEDGGNWEPDKHPGEAVEPYDRLVTTWASVKSEY
jgi:hypothetical protein